MSPNQYLAVMKKKFQNEDPLKEKYVPVNTLVEPKNVISSWEAGNEEKKEVSNTMKKLRLKLDNIQKQVRQKEIELDNLKNKLEQAKLDEENTKNKNMNNENMIEDYSDTNKSLQETHDYELMLQKTYQHMIQRMKADLISIQIKANEANESYKSKLHIMNEETEKARKSRQELMQFSLLESKAWEQIRENHIQ